jgi:hypothetical protein
VFVDEVRQVEVFFEKGHQVLGELMMIDKFAEWTVDEEVSRDGRCEEKGHPGLENRFHEGVSEQLLDRNLMDRICLIAKKKQASRQDDWK